MQLIENDGGRAKAGFKGPARDCFCRSVAIVTGRPYKEIYDLVNEYGKNERTGSKKKKKSNARTGVHSATARKIMADLGFEWLPTMQIGQGCQVHLTREELPPGLLVVSVSRHYTAIIDGVIHDTHDPSRDGTRCVYGYWMQPPKTAATASNTQKGPGRPPGTTRGKKERISITIDPDNLAWLKAQGPSYATLINRLIEKERTHPRK